MRKGRRTAFIALPQGYGVASERMFYGAPPTVELGLDPLPQGRERDAGRRADEVRRARHAGDLLRSDGGAPGGRERVALVARRCAPELRRRIDGRLPDRAGQVSSAPAGQQPRVRRSGGRAGRMDAAQGREAGDYRGSSRPAQHIRVHVPAGRHLGPHRLHHVLRGRAWSSSARTERWCVCRGAPHSRGGPGR